ncbi:tetratricopeptide repeat protein [Niabella ginsengisoli]|uniref:Tetratricopeptide repeat protein n=1 Tax=Niabella ginsengisoli TaxID=522298 RepID=A0ABS9SH38_9BACT|nr:tetratricopeptide repeat protein [Niabella ginsengisoli]MCH5597469.1 tetratricopeptide repeat protein [Niabella ginsengisoli]
MMKKIKQGKNKYIKRILFFISFCLLLFSTTIHAQVPDTKVMKEKADSLKDEKQYEAAVTLYEALIKKEPTNSYFLEKAGFCYFFLENYPKAREKYTLSALYRDANDATLLASDYANLVAVYARLNMPEKEMEYSLKAYQAHETPFSLWNAVSALNDNNKFEEGLKLLNNANIVKGPEFDGLYGLLYYKMGYYDKSIAMFELFFTNCEYVKSELANISMGDMYEWAWYALTYPLSIQNFEQPLIKADSVKMVRWFQKLIEYDGINSIIDGTIKQITSVNKHTKVYNPIYLQLANSLPQQYCLEKIGILSAINDYDAAALVKCNESDVAEKKKPLFHIYRFRIDYNQFLVDWKAGKATLQDERWHTVTDLFSHTLGNITNIDKAMVEGGNKAIEVPLLAAVYDLFEKGKKQMPTEDNS